MRCCSRLAVVVAACLGSAACGDNAAVIVIDGDLSVPDDVDGLCLSVADSDGAGGEFARFYVLGEDVSLPQSLTVEPGSASSAVALVRGYRGGIEVARDRREFNFGGVVDVDLALDACRSFSGGAPTDAGRIDSDLPPGVRVAASIGRGGTVIAAVGAGGSLLFVADGGLRSSAAVLPDAPSAAAPVGLEAFDADGDCDDDLLVLWADAAPSLWLRGAGETFTESTDAFASAGLGPVRAASAADVDSDGDLDLVVGAGAAVTLLRNDGAARFQPDDSAIANNVATDVTALAFGDIDRDGHVDLVVGQGDATAAPNRVLLNDASGGGFFELAAAVLPEVPLRTRALAVRDVDGDRFQDLLVGAIGSPVRLYVNRGDGRLEDRSFITLPNVDPVNAVSVAVGDWDGDCLSDIVVGLEGGSESPLTWHGSDTGTLVDESFNLVAGEHVTLVDVDDDGERDLIAVGDDGIVWVTR